MKRIGDDLLFAVAIIAIWAASPFLMIGWAISEAWKDSESPELTERDTSSTRSAIKGSE
jgi:hypothetical protein